MQFFQEKRDTDKFQGRQYKDLDLDFKKNPFTKDILIKKGDNAIKQSLKNLVLTRMGEKPFQPLVGSQVYDFLFDNVDHDTAFHLKESITRVINNFEPRVEIEYVDVEEHPDDNRYEVSIIFSIFNESDPITVDFFLERLR